MIYEANNLIYAFYQITVRRRQKKRNLWQIYQIYLYDANFANIHNNDLIANNKRPNKYHTNNFYVCGLALHRVCIDLTHIPTPV